MDTFKNLSKEELINLLQSQRHQIQQLQIERDQYSDLYNHAPVGYVTLDQEGKILSANRTARNLMQQSRDELLNNAFRDFIQDMDKPAFSKAFEQLQQAGQVTCEIQLTSRMTLIEGQAWQEIDNETLYVLAMTDVTALHDAEAALMDSQAQIRMNEERFRTALKNSPIIVFNQDAEQRYVWIYNPLPGLSEADFIDKTDADLFAPAVAEELMTLKQQVLDSGQSIRQEITFPWQDKLHYFDMVVEPLRTVEGRIIGITCAAMDITPNREAAMIAQEQRLLAEALQDTAIAINSSLHLPEVLDYILAHVGRVVPHDVADILLLTGDHAELVRSRGYSVHGLKKTAIILGESIVETPILNEIIESRKPLVIDDLQRVPSYAKNLDQAWMRSYAGVPIMWRGDIIGFLNLFSKASGFYTEEHTKRLLAFALQAGLAIRNAQLFEEAQEAATLEERQRLAHDLHDAVSQVLFTSNIIAESLQRIWDKEREQIPEHLEKLRRLNRGALSEMRTLLGELRPETLEHTDLPHLLRQLGQAAEGRTQITVVVVAHEQESLPKEVHLVFYRIAQEALNNIVKHAHADFVKITYQYKADKAALKIEDDGQGFDKLKVKGQSMGLRIMQERLAGIGASLHVDTKPDAGTIIIAQWHHSGKLTMPR